MAEARQKTYASGISLNLGMFSLMVDAVPVRKTNSTKAVQMKSVCPSCTDPTTVTQQYVCENGHGPFTSGQLAKAKEVDGALVAISATEAEAIKGTEREGEFNLQVCPADELEAATRPSEAAYRLRLGKKGVQADRYALLVDLVSDPATAIYGLCKLNGRSTMTPYRLLKWKGQLVMQSLIRPEDLGEIDEAVPGCDPKFLEMGKALLEASRAPFDPESLKDARVDRIEQVVSGKQGVAVLVPAAAPADDLMSLLEASLKAAKAA